MAITIKSLLSPAPHYHGDPWEANLKTILTNLATGLDDPGGGVGVKALTTNLKKGFLPIDLLSLREILSNDFADETIVSTGGSEKASGGILALDGAIGFIKRVNGATDKAARVVLKANTTGEFQFSPIPLPHDLDETADVSVHLMTEMAGATDTPTIDVQAFAGKGDTEMGGATSALSNAIEEKVVTLLAADIPAHPNFLNIMLVPGAHANDAIHIYAAWLEYTKKD